MKMIKLLILFDFIIINNIQLRFINLKIYKYLNDLINEK
jgi:hypothetical protein